MIWNLFYSNFRIIKKTILRKSGLKGQKTKLSSRVVDGKGTNWTLCKQNFSILILVKKKFLSNKKKFNIDIFGPKTFKKSKGKWWNQTLVPYEFSFVLKGLSWIGAELSFFSLSTLKINSNRISPQIFLFKNLTHSPFYFLPHSLFSFLLGPILTLYCLSLSNLSHINFWQTTIIRSKTSLFQNFLLLFRGGLFHGKIFCSTWFWDLLESIKRVLCQEFWIAGESWGCLNRWVGQEFYGSLERINS